MSTVFYVGSIIVGSLLALFYGYVFVRVCAQAYFEEKMSYQRKLMRRLQQG